MDLKSTAKKKRIGKAKEKRFEEIVTTTETPELMKKLFEEMSEEEKIERLSFLGHTDEQINKFFRLQARKKIAKRDQNYDEKKIKSALKNNDWEELAVIAELIGYDNRIYYTKQELSAFIESNLSKPEK